jgi:hypothetical protein
VSCRITQSWITRCCVIEYWIARCWITRCSRDERQTRLDADDKTWVEKEKFSTKVRWSSDTKFVSTRDYLEWQILLRYAFSLTGRSGFLVFMRRMITTSRSYAILLYVILDLFRFSLSVSMILVLSLSELENFLLFWFWLRDNFFDNCESRKRRRMLKNDILSNEQIKNEMYEDCSFWTRSEKETRRKNSW